MTSGGGIETESTTSESNGADSALREEYDSVVRRLAAQEAQHRAEAKECRAAVRELQEDALRTAEVSDRASSELELAVSRLADANCQLKNEYVAVLRELEEKEQELGHTRIYSNDLRLRFSGFESELAESRSREAECSGEAAAAEQLCARAAEEAAAARRALADATAASERDAADFEARLAFAAERVDRSPAEMSQELELHREPEALRAALGGLEAQLAEAAARVEGRSVPSVAQLRARGEALEAAARERDAAVVAAEGLREALCATEAELRAERSLRSECVAGSVEVPETSAAVAAGLEELRCRFAAVADRASLGCDEVLWRLQQGAAAEGSLEAAAQCLRPGCPTDAVAVGARSATDSAAADGEAALDLGDARSPRVAAEVEGLRRRFAASAERLCEGSAAALAQLAEERAARAQAVSELEAARAEAARLAAERDTVENALAAARRDVAAGSSDGQLGDFRRQLEATTERLLESSAAAAVQLCEERAAKEEAKRALESATAEILKLREAAQAKEAESERQLRSQCFADVDAERGQWWAEMEELRRRLQEEEEARAIAERRAADVEDLAESRAAGMVAAVCISRASITAELRLAQEELDRARRRRGFDCGEGDDENTDSIDVVLGCRSCPEVQCGAARDAGLQRTASGGSTKSMEHVQDASIPEARRRRPDVDEELRSTLQVAGLEGLSLAVPPVFETPCASPLTSPHQQTMPPLPPTPCEAEQDCRSLPSQEWHSEDPHQGDVVLQGYLRKKQTSGLFGSWHRRYFVLRGSSLSWYQSEATTETLCGVLELTAGTELSVEKTHVTVNNHRRQLILRADSGRHGVGGSSDHASIDDMSEWVSAIGGQLQTLLSSG